MKKLIRRALSTMGFRPPDRSLAGRFPLYRSLHLPSQRAEDVRDGRLVFVMPPVARGSGGLADILHLGEALRRQQGFDVWYLLPDNQPPAEARENIHWANLGAPDNRIVERLDNPPEFLCCTSWPTVYRGLTLPARQKLYFVQDYEPAFYPAGVAQYYAEQTYRLGLPIITLGPWLKTHLESKGVASRMAAMPFPFSDEIQPPSDQPRDCITFYVQPDKMHRGSELLIEAARMLAPRLAERDPHLRMVFFGSRINPHIKFDFPCEAHGVLEPAALLDLLRRTRIGVCASFTNISLMPFRYVAAGAPFVDVDLPSVRENIPSFLAPISRCAAPSAEELTRAIMELIDGLPSPDIQRSCAERLARDQSWAVCASIVARFARDVSEGTLGD